MNNTQLIDPNYEAKQQALEYTNAFIQSFIYDMYDRLYTLKGNLVFRYKVEDEFKNEEIVVFRGVEMPQSIYYYKNDLVRRWITFSKDFIGIRVKKVNNSYYYTIYTDMSLEQLEYGIWLYNQDNSTNIILHKEVISPRSRRYNRDDYNITIELN